MRVAFHCHPLSVASADGVAGVAGVVGEPGHPGQAGNAGVSQRDARPVTQHTAILLTIEPADGIQGSFPNTSGGPVKTVTAWGYARLNAIRSLFNSRSACGQARFQRTGRRENMEHRHLIFDEINLRTKRLKTSIHVVRLGAYPTACTQTL